MTQAGITFLNELINGTVFFGVTDVIGIILALFTMMLLTRDTERWKTLFLPVLIGWHLCGVVISLPLMFLSSITFVITHLSIRVIGELLVKGSNIVASPLAMGRDKVKANRKDKRDWLAKSEKIARGKIMKTSGTYGQWKQRRSELRDFHEKDWNERVAKAKAEKIKVKNEKKKEKDAIKKSKIKGKWELDIDKLTGNRGKGNKPYPLLP